jgi:hypothetical protein
VVQEQKLRAPILYDIYSSSHDDGWRYTLGKDGRRKLLAIGLNPSTATKEKSDMTVAKVEGVAVRNGFDGFVMLNLYPVRATDFRLLPEEADARAYDENLASIAAMVASETQPVIWAAWGERVLARKFFVVAIKELFARLQACGVQWQRFGPLTASGHPRHPSRVRYGWHFEPFDTKRYTRILADSSSGPKTHSNVCAVHGTKLVG